MIVHTVVYFFPPEMTAANRDDFFAEVGSILISEGHAQRFEHQPHQASTADEHAPVFVASAIAQAAFPDLEALAEASALPAMREFMAAWRRRFAYRVVWANYATP